MKKIISLLTSLLMLGTMLIAPASAENEVSKIAFIGYYDVASWANPIATELGATPVIKTVPNMDAAITELEAVASAEPDMVVVDATLAKSDDTAMAYESLLLSIASFAKKPYVALVSASTTDASYNMTTTLSENFGVDHLCRANGDGASSLTYTVPGLPNPASKLSSMSQAMVPTNVYSATLSNEKVQINTNGPYAIFRIRNNGGIEKISVRCEGSYVYEASSVPTVAYVAKYGIGNRKHEFTIQVTGEAVIEAVYSEALPAIDIPMDQQYSFIDNNVSAFKDDGKNYSVSWSPEGATGNNGSALVNMLGSSDVFIPICVKPGSTFTVSAKLKLAPGSVNSTARGFVYSQRYEGDVVGNPIVDTNTYMADSKTYTLSANEWTDFSATFTLGTKGSGTGGVSNVPTSEYCRFFFRLTNGAKVYVDDVKITMAKSSTHILDTAVESFDINFDDGTPGIGAFPMAYNSYVDDGKGGKALLTKGMQMSSTGLNVTKVRFKPNRVYRVSFRYKAANADSAANKIWLVVNKETAKRVDSNGNTPKAPIDSSNYFTDSMQLSTDWQTYSKEISFATGDGAVDDTGIFSSLTFQCRNQSNQAPTPGGDVIVDDVKMEPLGVFVHGDFEGVSKMPQSLSMGTFTQSIVSGTDKDGNTSGMLKLTAKGDKTGTSDISLGLGLENGKRYRMSFDYKGENLGGNGVTIQPITIAENEKIGIIKNKYIYLTSKSVEEGWKHYSYDFTFDHDGDVERFAKMVVRFKTFEGVQYNVYMDNLTVEEIPQLEVSASDIYETSAVSVSLADDSRKLSKGYVYKIYSGDNVYANGVTKSNNISFANYAAAGETLYMDVSVIDSTGYAIAPYTYELGTVMRKSSQMTVSTGFSDDTVLEDGNVTGVVDITNDDVAKKVCVGLAVYDADEDVMLSFDITEADVDAYATEQLTIRPSSALDTDLNLVVKVFAWDANNAPLATASMISFE